MTQTKGRTHYIGMAGLHGCLPQTCDVYDSQAAVKPDSAAHQIVTLVAHGQPVPLELAQRARDHEEAQRDRLRESTAPAIVAECWTCCGSPGHISQPHEGQALCVPRALGFEGEYLVRRCRAAGHDVRDSK